jgi:hypothetical protein
LAYRFDAVVLQSASHRVGGRGVIEDSRMVEDDESLQLRSEPTGNMIAGGKAAADSLIAEAPDLLFTDPCSIGEQIWRAMWDAGTEVSCPPRLAK